MNIYFVRHGQTDWNAGKSPHKKRPVNEPLNSTGMAQAKKAARIIKELPETPPKIYHSPYFRTKQTAQIIAEVTGLEITEDKRLTEYFPGDWDGRPYNFFIEKFSKIPADTQSSFKPPNGESWSDMASRIKDLIASVTGSVVLVSHGDPIKAAVYSLLERTQTIETALDEFPPGSITKLKYVNKVWTKERLHP